MAVAAISLLSVQKVSADDPSSKTPPAKDGNAADNAPGPQADHHPMREGDFGPRHPNDAGGPFGPPMGGGPMNGGPMNAPAGPGGMAPNMYMTPPPGMPGSGGFMSKNDTEMYKLLTEDWDLERQSREKAIQYRNASQTERDKIRSQVNALVNKQFDVRQQRRTLELKRLDEELKRLRELADRREKTRKELIEKRVKELLGDGNPDF
jgi:hypothetical protein